MYFASVKRLLQQTSSIIQALYLTTCNEASKTDLPLELGQARPQKDGDEPRVKCRIL